MIKSNEQVMNVAEAVDTVKGQGTSEQILSAAIELFSQKGMNGTTTREIAAKAGVNIAALHYHWGGKEDLMKAVYQRVLDEVAVLATEFFSQTYPNSNLAEGFARMLGRVYDFFADHPAYARVILYGDLEDPAFLKSLREQTVAPLIQQMSFYLKGLMAAGVLAKTDPEPLLIMLYGGIMLSFANSCAQYAIFSQASGNGAEEVRTRFRTAFISMSLRSLGLVN